MPIEISGIVFHISPIYLDHTESHGRFEICGECQKNDGGKCLENGENIKNFIYYAESGCPINLWERVDRTKEMSLLEQYFKPCCKNDN